MFLRVMTFNISSRDGSLGVKMPASGLAGCGFDLGRRRLNLSSMKTKNHTSFRMTIKESVLLAVILLKLFVYKILVKCGRWRKSQL